MKWRVIKDTLIYSKRTGSLLYKIFTDFIILQFGRQFGDPHLNLYLDMYMLYLHPFLRPPH